MNVIQKYNLNKNIQTNKMSHNTDSMKEVWKNLDHIKYLYGFRLELWSWIEDMYYYYYYHYKLNQIPFWSHFSLQ